VVSAEYVNGPTQSSSKIKQNFALQSTGKLSVMVTDFGRLF